MPPSASALRGLSTRDHLRPMLRSSTLLLLATLNGASAAARWVEVAANGTWPEPRFSHTAALIGNSSHMLLFGGNNFDACNELFAFDIARREWTKLKAAGTLPSKRYGHQAVVTADGRMVIHGGYNGSFLGDVHELEVKVANNGTLQPRWRKVSTTGEAPTPRDGHSAILAPDGVTMLIYGGFDGKAQLDDLIALDTRTYEWSRTEIVPPEDMGTADGADDVEAEDGAASAAAGDAAGDAEGDADAPAPRYQHTAVACPGGMVVYGGYLAGGAFADDLWRLRLVGNETKKARWEQLQPKGDAPGGTFGHAAAVDASGARMWLSGGFGKGAKGGERSAFSSQLHVLDLAKPRWTRIGAGGTVPSPRHKHTLIAAKNGQLLLFGGNDFGPTRGFYALDTAAALVPPPPALTVFVTIAVQLVQLASLVAVAIASWMRRLGVLTSTHTAAVLTAALMYLFGLERLAPPPGGFVARAIGRPKRARAGVRSAVAPYFERSGLSTATDVVAAIAAAGMASLIASAGGPPMRLRK